MRKKIMLAVAAASLVTLTGCLAGTYPLTDEEQDIIAEYAVTVLLRNDENYTQALITPTPTPEVLPSPTPTFSPKPTGTEDGKGGGSKKPGTEVTENASLSEVYGLEGLSVAYDGYQIVDTLKENSGYIVRAQKGKKLLQVDFTLTNTAGITQEFDFFGQDISYLLDDGGNKSIPAKITGMGIDMLSMETELAAGASCAGCVVFEVPEKWEPDGKRVIVSRDTYTSVTKLK